MDCFRFGEWSLADSSADTFSPGQVPTQEHRSAAEANFWAVGPTSAMICCAESAPKPGIWARRCRASAWGCSALANASSNSWIWRSF